MHQPGLHPAFVPARALLEPCPEASRRFLVGGRRQYIGAIAKTAEAHSKVGVFGQVVGIPAADFAEHGGPEMVRRSAEWQRQMLRCECRHQNVELTSVACRKHPS